MNAGALRSRLRASCNAEGIAWAGLSSREMALALPLPARDEFRDKYDVVLVDGRIYDVWEIAFTLALAARQG